MRFMMADTNEELSTQEEGSTESTSIVEEIFSQVLGPERPGGIRTYGFGPSPTDVFGGEYKKSQVQALLFKTM